LLAAAGPAAPDRAAALGSPPAGLTCPSCGAGLLAAPYEGIELLLCERCGGRLVSTPQVGKLLARREAAFTDEQERLADLLSSGGDRLRRAAVLARGRPGVLLIGCPGCAAPMMRSHYSYEHAVEVDRCVRCDLLWFERDELEALQILVERQTG
jgi:Zn-finger nucleic acid-binding protein